MPHHPTRIVIPDFFSIYDFPEAINPAYQSAGEESYSWIQSFDVFGGRKAAFFSACNTPLLTGMTYPYADSEALRTCCDFMNILFAIDDICDDLDGEETKNIGRALVVGMQDANFDSTVLSRITYETRFVRRVGQHSLRRFGDLCADYIKAVANESAMREQREVFGLEEYILHRRQNSATPLAFGLIEYTLGIDLPDEVFEDATFMAIYWTAVDLVNWANDIFSYKKERASGQDGNNIITVLMHEHDFNVQQAVDYVGDLCESLVLQYEKDKATQYSWPTEIKTAVDEFVAGLEYWVMGNLSWSFQCFRYFGTRGNEVRRTRVVELF